MNKIQVNDNEPISIEATESGFVVNNKLMNMDVSRLGERELHIIHEHRSYNVELVNAENEKSLLIKVNGNEYKVLVKDKFDQLLADLGMEDLAVKKIREVKAPMPGLVLNMLAEVGQEVKKGDNLVVLEAMKMENILKSPADGRVSRIKVQTGDKVEKNAVLLEFE